MLLICMNGRNDMGPNKIPSDLIKLEPYKLEQILGRIPNRSSDNFTPPSLACYLSQYYWDNHEKIKARNWETWRDVVHSFEADMCGR